MTAHELLSQLRAKGVQVKTSGDNRLVIDAPRGTVNEELRSALSANKAELLQILGHENTEAKAPAIAETVAAQPKSSSPVAAPPAIPSHADDQIAASTAEEIRQLQAELTRLRIDEEGRRAEVEAVRLAAENGLRVEQEKWRQQEEEIARQRAEHERRRIEVEARARAEEEQRRRIANEEISRAQAVLEALRASEEKRRHEAEERFRVGQQAHEAQLASLRQTEEEQARRRAEEERHYLELEARKRAQEDELRRRAETRFRAVEEEIERVTAREQARLRVEQEAQLLVEEAGRRRTEEEARRKAEEQARRRAEEEARLRAEIEVQVRAESAERRRAEEETRRRAEEEARHRAEEEAQRIAAERARRLAEEEAQRRAAEEASRQAEAAALLKAKEDEQRHAQEQARLKAEQDERDRLEAIARERAELEARIRAEIEAKIRAEEEDKRREEDAERRRAEHERMVAEEAGKAGGKSDFAFEIERPEIEEPAATTTNAPETNVTEVVEWFEVGLENRANTAPVPDRSQDHFRTLPDEDHSEFRAVSVPEEATQSPELSRDLENDLRSANASARAAAVAELPKVGGEEAYHRITAAFDDQSAEVRSSAARALFDLQDDCAAAFTRALREASPQRRRTIGAAIGSSGLANEAIRNLTGESRDQTYDPFFLLFLMSKAGEVKPLMRAIEEHPNTEVRLAVVKLLALSGQPDVLAAFRRMAVRGSLPAEVRSAVMEAIYQITSQSPVEAGSM